MGSGITGVESHKKGMYLLRTEYLSLLLNSVYMWQLRSMKILRYFFHFTLFISFFLLFQWKWALAIFLILTFNPCPFQDLCRVVVEHPARVCECTMSQQCQGQYDSDK